jgi:hypothetical protein
MEKKKASSNIIITELFLVKADWTRTYLGEIRREVTKEGKQIVRGNVMINEGKIWSFAETEEILRDMMNGICTMKLDMGLHSISGVTLTICETKYYLN